MKLLILIFFSLTLQAEEVNSPLIQKISRDAPNTPQERSEGEKVFLLILPGGGTNGAGETQILKRLHQNVLEKSDGKVNLRFGVLGDTDRIDTLIAGTSAGSINAGVLKAGINQKTGKAPDFQEMQDLTLKMAKKMFRPNLRCLCGWPCMAPYSKSHLHKISRDYGLEERTFGETPNLVMAIYDKNQGQDIGVSQNNPQFKDVPIGSVFRASSSIPCVFRPEVIKGRPYADGGTSLSNNHPVEKAMDEIDYLNFHQKTLKIKELVILDTSAGTACLGDCTLISKNNCGGAMATLLDGTICDVLRVTQKSSDYEQQLRAKIGTRPYPVQVYTTDFPMQYPLAFTESCIQHTIDVADKAYDRKEKEMDELAQWIVDRELRP